MADVPVAAPLKVIVKLPAAVITDRMAVAAPSISRSWHTTMLVAATSEFDTTMLLAAAARATRPRGELLLTLPGVPLESVKVACKFDVLTVLGVVAPTDVPFTDPPVIATEAGL